MMETPSPMAPLAAMLYPDLGSPEGLLAAFAAELQSRNLRIGGVLQTTSPRPGSIKGVMELVDLAGGSRIALSQDLGTGSSACTLDLSALAQASVLVRQAVDQGCDLVIFNKFSHQERSGRGLAADIAYAALRGVPVLTALRPAASEDWAQFTGGAGAVLAPEIAALRSWWLECQTANMAG